MRIFLAATTVFCLFFPGHLPLQGAIATSNSNLSVQVVQNFYFGGLLVSQGGGSITLTADGALIPLGPGIQPNAQMPSSEARFRLSGPPGTAFTIEVIPALPALMGPRGDALRIAELQSFPVNMRGTFDKSGQAEFKLGGRLDIPANVNPGVFTARQVRLDLSIASGGEPKRVSTYFSISALLRAPLKLSNLSSLDFGALIPGAASGDFEVYSSGSFQSLSPNGPTHLKSNPHPAAFSLQGPAGASFSIRLPKQAILSGPGSGLLVHSFTCDTPLNGVLPPGGINFNVGGRITINPDQTYGRYHGTFRVDVNYQ